MSTVLSTDELREKIAHELSINPTQFTSVLARRYGVSEAEILRAHPAELVTELDASRSEEIIRAFERLGRVMVLVSNEGAILEANGNFGGFSKEMGFLNIITDTLDVHVRPEKLASAFAYVKKPHMGSNITHSIQFFSERGEACLKVFVLDYVAKQEEGRDYAQQVKTWEEIRDEFRLQPALVP